jgi:hypothetical protein
VAEDYVLTIEFGGTPAVEGYFYKDGTVEYTRLPQTVHLDYLADAVESLGLMRSHFDAYGSKLILITGTFPRWHLHYVNSIGLQLEGIVDDQNLLTWSKFPTGCQLEELVSILRRCDAVVATSRDQKATKFEFKIVP